MSIERQAARGNPSRRKPRQAATGQATLKALKADKITRPAWLSGKMEKKIWDGLREGVAAAFVRSSDVNAFGRYCVYMANWIEANGNLRETGSSVYETESHHVTMQRISPWFTIRSRLEDDLIKLESMLGLTPLDRMRILQQMSVQAALLPGAGLFESVDRGAAIPAGRSKKTATEISAIGGLARTVN
jgi:P27 family predicted phage terminase small subunit